MANSSTALNERNSLTPLMFGSERTRGFALHETRSRRSHLEQVPSFSLPFDLSFASLCLALLGFA